MEVRQRPRATGVQWFESKELAAYLDAFGDDSPSLPETIRVLDTIAVDYIIETCYEAESHARYAGRQKVKVDDFQFALRNDPVKLGRVQEMLEKEKRLKQARKVFELPEGAVTKEVGDGKRGRRGRKKDKDGGVGVGKKEKSVKGARDGGVGEEDIDMDMDDED